ncbi:transcriptional regulator [Lentzea sp. NBRC 105346]|uniref:ArsR/SmtB family transcription factor n=1 Tax=Lentzea sp. NBRC 105346 TaxID=3032205 RepID=UPI0024A56EA2|nr:metalloregulator ArsR/SmtB family transcription factor [Lentzea sp. NBRC 105346]GLZ32341.1 transcriptional regulator [Lentzea sp. NBRC 105346]
MGTYQAAFTALGDPTRQLIFERLAAGPLSVGELAASLPVSRPAVSQHLKVLREARLVRSSSVGTRNVYSVDPAGVRAMRDYMDDLWGRALENFARVVEEEQ